MQVFAAGMPLLLANHPTRIGAAQVAYGMLLDCNNFNVMNRLNADDEHEGKYLNELPAKKNTKDVKKRTFMDEPRSAAARTFESLAYQPNCDLFYQNHSQNKQLEAQQQMLPGVDGFAATTTPLQHLTNLFGLKVPWTTTSSSSSSAFSSNGMLDSTSLQYFSAAMQSEREQYEKIFREFYGVKAPQLGKCNNKVHQQQLAQQAQATLRTADVVASNLQNQLIQASTTTAPSNSSTPAATTTTTNKKDSLLSALIFEGEMRNSSMNMMSAGHAALLAARESGITNAGSQSPAATTNTSTTAATVAGKHQIKARAVAAVAKKPELVAVEAATTIQPSAISSQNKRSTKGMQNING